MQEFTSVLLVKDDVKGLDKDLSILTVPQEGKRKLTCHFFPLLPDFNPGKNWITETWEEIHEVATTVRGHYCQWWMI